MSTDRELLELAAKAAQYETYFGNGGMRMWKNPNVEWVDWNPLTDDGDALRLAMKLNLRVVFHPVLGQAIVRPYHASEREQESFENVEDHAGDPYAATRRAIVRAAAQIGGQA